jgi:hypothetical protein
VSDKVRQRSFPQGVENSVESSDLWVKIAKFLYLTRKNYKTGPLVEKSGETHDLPGGKTTDPFCKPSRGNDKILPTTT